MTVRRRFWDNGLNPNRHERWIEEIQSAALRSFAVERHADEAFLRGDQRGRDCEGDEEEKRSGRVYCIHAGCWLMDGKAVQGCSSAALAAADA